MKKKKVNKRKFLSRIFFLIILIIVIILVIKNLGKKEEAKFDISIILNNENITNTLEDEPYLNKDNVLYLSFNDVRNIFDSNIYYEDGKIITTSETKVAAIDVKSNVVELNNATLLLSNGVLDYGENSYIPISEMTNVYSIEAYTTEKSAVISSLQKEFVTIKTTKKINIKEKTSSFSKTLQKLKENTELIYISEAGKNNWIKVLTFERKHRIH